MLSDISMSFAEIISESTNEAETTHKALFRVKDSAKWSKALLEILRAEGEEYGASIRKEYYLSEEMVPTFVWVVLLWGELEAAKIDLLRIFAESDAKVETKILPKGDTPNSATPISKRTLKSRDGSKKTVVTVPLPHFRRNAKVDPDKVVGLRSRGFGATVTNLQETGR